MEKIIIISKLKGGFGNQLFQFATAYSLAKKNNATLKVDLSFYQKEQYTKWFKLDRLNIKIEKASHKEIDLLSNKPNPSLIFRLLTKLGIKSSYNKSTDLADCDGFVLDRKILNNTGSGIISGWCVKEGYFKDYIDDLRNEFVMKKQFSKSAQKYLSEIRSNNSVSVHIRRGDYIGLEHFFRILPIGYFNDAIENLRRRLEKPTFYFFSNDLDWVKENINYQKDFIFVNLQEDLGYNGENDIEDFFLMKNCKHNIIANSSFSWWAAYLNDYEEKIIIAPKIWYNDQFWQKSFEENPICPSDWLLL